jgi:hypothetical protein
MRSFSGLRRCKEKKLNSFPSAVSVGLVIGAEIVEGERPCETVIGERGDGPSWSYGTDRSLRSEALLFFLPKSEVMDGHTKLQLEV